MKARLEGTGMVVGDFFNFCWKKYTKEYLVQ